MIYILRNDAIQIEKDIIVYNKYSTSEIHKKPRMLELTKEYIYCIIIN